MKVGRGPPVLIIVSVPCSMCNSLSDEAQSMLCVEGEGPKREGGSCIRDFARMGLKRAGERKAVARTSGPPATVKYIMATREKAPMVLSLVCESEAWPSFIRGVRSSPPILTAIRPLARCPLQLPLPSPDSQHPFSPPLLLSPPWAQEVQGKLGNG